MNNVLILGDSYSTFEGYIPSGYAIYYASGKRENMGVVDVSLTWWHKALKKAVCNLIMNNSWSGSTIGYTGYGGADCSKTSSFIYRFNKLISEGFFEKNKIDTLLIFGGTNDSWSNAPLGEAKTDHIEEEDLFSVLPAIHHLLSLAKKTLPEANIICIINTDIKKEITDALESSSAMLGIKSIRLSDIDKIDGHPTAKGMESISEQVLPLLL